MTILLLILGFASLAHLGADFLSQYDRLPDKPFKCNMCSGFWYSIGVYIGLYGWEGILLAAITGITSEAIYKILNRL